MFLTPALLLKLKAIVEKHHVAFLVDAWGSASVSSVVLDELKAQGWVASGKNTVEDAYLFGQLAAQLGTPAAKALSYDQFQAQLQKNPIPLTTAEQHAVQTAQLTAAQYVVGLGNVVDKDVGQIVVNADHALAAKLKGDIVDETAKNLEARKTVKQLRSDLGHRMQDWTRNLDRIAITEKHNALDMGVAAGIEKTHGDSSRVCKLTQPGACTHCIRLHVGPDGAPRIFKLSQLAAPGANVKKKPQDWVACIGAVHPHCQCLTTRVPVGWAFDKDGNMVPGGTHGIEYDDEQDVEKAMRAEDAHLEALEKAFKLHSDLEFQGFDIAIEQGAGGIRFWKDRNGEQGQTTMKFPYGYIRRTKGTDDDAVDVYVGPDPRAENVYVIAQRKKLGEGKFGGFDEQKCMLGFSNAEAAKAAYLAHYNDEGFFGGMMTLPVEEFRRKVLATWEQTKPALIKSDIALVVTLQKAVDDGDIRGDDGNSVTGVAGANIAMKNPPLNKWEQDPSKYAEAILTVGEPMEPITVDPRIYEAGDRVAMVRPIVIPEAMQLVVGDLDDQTQDSKDWVASEMKRRGISAPLLMGPFLRSWASMFSYDLNDETIQKAFEGHSGAGHKYTSKAWHQGHWIYTYVDTHGGHVVPHKQGAPQIALRVPPAKKAELEKFKADHGLKAPVISAFGYAILPVHQSEVESLPKDMPAHYAPPKLVVGPVSVTKKWEKVEAKAVTANAPIGSKVSAMGANNVLLTATKTGDMEWKDDADGETVIPYIVLIGDGIATFTPAGAALPKKVESKAELDALPIGAQIVEVSGGANPYVFTKLGPDLWLKDGKGTTHKTTYVELPGGYTVVGGTEETKSAAPKLPAAEHGIHATATWTTHGGTTYNVAKTGTSHWVQTSGYDDTFNDAEIDDLVNQYGGSFGAAPVAEPSGKPVPKATTVEELWEMAPGSKLFLQGPEEAVVKNDEGVWTSVADGSSYDTVAMLESHAQFGGVDVLKDVPTIPGKKKDVTEALQAMPVGSKVHAAYEGQALTFTKTAGSPPWLDQKGSKSYGDEIAALGPVTVLSGSTEAPAAPAAVEPALVVPVEAPAAVAAPAGDVVQKSVAAMSASPHAHKLVQAGQPVLVGSTEGVLVGQDYKGRYVAKVNGKRHTLSTSLPPLAGQKVAHTPSFQKVAAHALLEPTAQQKKLVKGVLDGYSVGSSDAKAHADWLHAKGHEVYLVGGIVRDLIAGTDPTKPLSEAKITASMNDVDFVSSAPPNLLAECLSSVGHKSGYGSPEFVQKGCVTNGVLDLASLSSGGVYDQATYDANTGEHGIPSAFDHDLDEDASRRDFTANALYYDVHNEAIIDPTGTGVADVRAQVLRRLPGDTWAKNPKLAIRFWKLRGRGWTGEPETTKQVVALAAKEFAGLSHFDIAKQLYKNDKSPQKALDKFKAAMEADGAGHIYAQYIAPQASSIVSAMKGFQK